MIKYIIAIVILTLIYSKIPGTTIPNKPCKNNWEKISVFIGYKLHIPNPYVIHINPIHDDPKGIVFP